MKKYFYSMGFMNYCSHDPGCALIKTDGNDFEIIYAEEGFLSRKKKSYQFPLRSMHYCLSYFDICLDEVDVLMLDYMDRKTNYRTSNNYRLLIGDFIRSRLNIDHKKISYAPSHHYAHALTAYWPSGFDDCGVMVVDGLGSGQQTHSIYQAKADKPLKLVFEQKGTGIGSLYTLLTEALGWDSGEEGKTMGLAPYGEKHAHVDQHLPSLKGHYDKFTVDYSEQLFRNPSLKLKFHINKPANKKDVYDPYYSRLAFNLQQETEQCLLHLAQETLDTLQTDSLCFAGGVALNCVANNKIQNIDSVKRFYVQPASSDAGLPIGLALAGLEKLGFSLSAIFNAENRDKLARSFSQDHNPLEKLYATEFDKLLKSHHVKSHPFNPQIIANKLENKHVVALFSEGIEIGPRALGNRSFLADPREFAMKEILNAKIKHREGYRPFAPIILKEEFNNYFISDTNNHPYMLQAPKCKPLTEQAAPAICHVDKTSRVQTLDKSNRKIRKIVECFHENTGVPIVINTSFNDNNEPIVFTKFDAMNTFLHCNADVLVLENDVYFRDDLIDHNALKHDVLKFQRKFYTEYFISALRKHTDIDCNTQESDLSAFIRFNSSLSKYHRDERITLKLLDFLFNRDKEKMLYIDQYHLEKIREILRINAIKWENIIFKSKVIDDSIEAGNIMLPESDFILYNFSAFYLSEFMQADGWKNNNLTCFYSLEDKILSPSLISNQKEKLQSTFDSVLNSYEHCHKRTINDFFLEYE